MLLLHSAGSITLIMKQPRAFLLIIGDSIALSIAFVATLMFGFGGSVPQETWILHARPFALLYIVWLLIFYIFELYDVEYHRHGVQLYNKITKALLAALLASIAFFYIFPFFGITPRANLIINMTVFAVFFTLWRVIFSNRLAQYFHINTLIIDPKNRLTQLKELLRDNPQLGLGNPTSATTIQTPLPSHVIIDSKYTPDHIIEKLLQKPIYVSDAVSTYEHYFQKVPVHLVDTEWILYHAQKKKNLFYEVFHSVFDRFVAILLIILTLPITILTILAILIEDGKPVFYKQERVGHYGKSFLLYKFRSMRTDAEKNGPQWSSGASDTRTTRVGKIIRKLHIDEIPQMINILQGDIALVGPRAERPNFVRQLEEEIPHYKLRHIIKPGFTGWAQVKFFYARSVIDSLEKFQYDLYYIKNRNLIMDAAIMLRTAYIILKH